MSYHIPVFYFPIDRSEVPASFDEPNSLLDLVAQRYDSPEEHGLRSTMSRNWWHQQVLLELSNGLGLDSLHFAGLPAVCLDAEELQTVDRDLATLFEVIRTGIPDLGKHEPKHGGVWWIRRDTGSDEAFAAILSASLPSLDASSDEDIGPKAVGAFCSFVKSLQEALREAREQNKCLLYVQPQP